MKSVLLFLCIIAQTSSLLPAPKRNLQSTQKRLLLQQEVLRSQLCTLSILESCPTKPPKKYYGSHEKVRLQQGIDHLKACNEQMRKNIAPKATISHNDTPHPAIIIAGMQSKL